MRESIGCCLKGENKGPKCDSCPYTFLISRDTELLKQVIEEKDEEGKGQSCHQKGRGIGLDMVREAIREDLLCPLYRYIHIYTRTYYIHIRIVHEWKYKMFTITITTTTTSTRNTHSWQMHSNRVAQKRGWIPKCAHKLGSKEYEKVFAQDSHHRGSIFSKLLLKKRKIHN